MTQQSLDAHAYDWTNNEYNTKVGGIL
ncbi:MAG: hypothetical protein ACJA2O_001895 [Candidatus Azotimanducaceae bacterium]